jgi:hypothetical protein
MAGAAGTGNVCGARVSPGPYEECVVAADCDHQMGPRGCGTWVCNRGVCEAAFDCQDADGDGFGTGPDCACTGKALDCDDGDNAVGDSATASCCNGGTRSCKNGTWALCSGASGETCDGVDNDCNGAIDDLGVVSCGFGACRKTIAACSGGVLGVCVPDAPLTTIDGCNGIDDDCDGTVDEDCPSCLHVAPDGDDTLARANQGATSFASVQAAIDFADAHREFAHRVCVAAGPACGATATFAGPAGADLTMRDGVSVLGSYESSCWTHCDDSVTTLAPQTAAGVLFPANIAIETALDGFTITSVYDPTLDAAVTVDGAHGVVLSNLTIPVGARSPLGGYSSGTSDGISLKNGASASVLRSYVEAGAGLTASAIRAVGAEVHVEDACPTAPDGATGHCTASCDASGPKLVGHAGDNGVVFDAFALQDAAGSRIERSAVCGSTHYSGPSAIVSVTGAGAGVVLRANVFGGHAYGSGSSAAALSFAECEGAAPWIVDNESIGLTVFRSANDVLLAKGDCHPVIEANHAIGVTSDSTQQTGVSFAATAVHCEAGTVASRCVIAHNTILGALENMPTSYVLGQGLTGLGVRCDGGSCARIESNQITGCITNIACQSGACQRSGQALVLSGGAPYVAHNVLNPGSGWGMTNFTQFTALASTGVTAGTLVHNVWSGGFDGAALDYEYNVGSVVWHGGGTVSNNCLSLREADASSDPLVFTNNYVSQYVDEGTTTLTTPAQINALTDMVSSGNTNATCPLPTVNP